MFPKSVLNVWCRVSVSTKVPAMKVTPNTIARAVSARRSLCAMRPFRVTRHISVPQCPHALEDGIGCWRGELVDDVAVSEENDPVGICSTVRIVRHHDDRLAELGHR